jgi:hypothetical protein
LRRHLVLLALPLMLAACDSSNPPAPAANAPAAQPAAKAPATPAANAAPAAAAATAPLFGSWAADPANCGTPIVISATSFEGAENSCDISGFTDNGDGTFVAAMSCNSQGQTANERIQMEPLFGPAGEGVRLSYLDRGGDPVVVFRCAAPRPN